MHERSSSPLSLKEPREYNPSKMKFKLWVLQVLACLSLVLCATDARTEGAYLQRSRVSDTPTKLIQHSEYSLDKGCPIISFVPLSFVVSPVVGNTKNVKKNRSDMLMHNVIAYVDDSYYYYWAMNSPS